MQDGHKKGAISDSKSAGPGQASSASVLLGHLDNRKRRSHPMQETGKNASRHTIVICLHMANNFAFIGNMPFLPDPRDKALQTLRHGRGKGTAGHFPGPRYLAGQIVCYHTCFDCRL